MENKYQSDRETGNASIDASIRNQFTIGAERHYNQRNPRKCPGPKQDNTETIWIKGLYQEGRIGFL